MFPHNLSLILDRRCISN